MITDEMIRTFKRIAFARHDNSTEVDLRAALEAVAPLLIADGILEAMEILGKEIEARSLAARRAQELDPK